MTFSAAVFSQAETWKLTLPVRLQRVVGAFADGSVSGIIHPFEVLGLPGS
jgi:hypothetical protein